MPAIECPTCEASFEVSRSLKIGDRIECPGCGEQLEVVSDDPLEVDYWDEEKAEEEAYEEETYEMEGPGKKIGRPFFPEDETAGGFELPEHSLLFGDDEEEEETEEGAQDPDEF